MYVDISSVLQSRNRTRYWLAKEIDCSYQSLLKLCQNETTSVSFDLLEKICIALDCTPSEILIIERDKYTQKEPS